MRKINVLKFEEKGIVIVFLPITTNRAKEQRYTFIVKDDDVLTKKLHNSFKRVDVIERYISTRARAIFELINSPDIIPFPSEEELNVLVETFREKFGYTPVFKFKDISKDKTESLSSHIINFNLVFEDGIGRNKLESKVNTLENLFKSLNKF